MYRAAWSMVVVMLLTGAEASAQELVWGSGARDIQVQGTAAACTLLVRTTAPLEALPAEWRLVWSGYADGATAFSCQDDGPQEGVAAVCEVRPAVSEAGVAGRADTVLHCSDLSGTRSVVARYVLNVSAGTTARIALVPGEASWADADLPLEGLSEATINGGAAPPYPPVLGGVHVNRIGADILVDAVGWFLGGVRAAALVVDTQRLSLEIVDAGARSLHLKATSPLGGERVHLEVADDNGAIGAYELPGGLAPDQPPWAEGRLLVRFRPGQVEPPAGRIEGLIGEVAFGSPALRDSLALAGVERLERLLPWFKHEDINSVNLIGEPVTLLDMADLYVAHLAAGSDAKTAASRMAKLTGVQYATPDHAVGGQFTPNDPYFTANLQWGLRNIGQTLCGFTGFSNVDIGATTAWDRSTGSADVQIAILDTGIDNSHPDLFPRAVLDTTFVPSEGPGDNDPNRHGTAVAGIAAAGGNDGFGVAGVAWNVTPVSIKVLNFQQAGTVSQIIQGIDRARVKGYPIVNMSLSVPGDFGLPPPPAADVAALNEACYNAFMVGHLLVASSGNTGIGFGDEFTDPRFDAYPAAFTHRVYAVGAMIPDNARWRDPRFAPPLCQSSPGSCRGSNFGPWLDVLAPGGRLIVTTRNSTPPDTFYHLRNCNAALLLNMGFGGTSAAAPFVSGTAALLKSIVPSLTGDDLEQILNLTTAYFGPNPAERFDQWYGRGYIRASLATGLVAPPKTVVQNSLQDTKPLAYLLISDSTSIPSRTFRNVPGLPAVYTTSCTRLRLRGSARHGGFATGPSIWVRPSATLGWRDTTTFDHAFEVPWARVTSVGTDSSSFETYVYRIPLSGGGEQYFPAAPPQARVAFTVVGSPRPVGVEEQSWASRLTLSTSPNPGKRGIWVDFVLPREGWIKLSVWDVTGRNVVNLSEGIREAGPTRLWWSAKGRDGTRCAPGVYWLRVEFEEAVVTRRFVLLGG